MLSLVGDFTCPVWQLGAWLPSEPTLNHLSDSLPTRNSYHKVKNARQRLQTACIYFRLQYSGLAAVLRHLPPRLVLSIPITIIRSNHLVMQGFAGCQWIYP